MGNHPRADLLPQRTAGNNRLQVLMDVQRSNYSSATSEAQSTMVKDWIETVTKFWGGRFIAMQDASQAGGTSDTPQFFVLTTENAEVILHQIMRGPSGNDNNTVPPQIPLPATGVEQSESQSSVPPPGVGGGTNIVHVQNMRNAAI